jgi:hypothetical protein
MTGFGYRACGWAFTHTVGHLLKRIQCYTPINIIGIKIIVPEKAAKSGKSFKIDGSYF